MGKKRNPDYDLLELLEPLPKWAKQKILKDLAITSERSYRRGFQHGLFAKDENPRISAGDNAVCSWRFKAHLNNYWVKRLPPTPVLGRSPSSTLARVLTETSYVTQDWISHLAHSVFPEDWTR